MKVFQFGFGIVLLLALGGLPVGLQAAESRVEAVSATIDADKDDDDGVCEVVVPFGLAWVQVTGDLDGGTLRLRGLRDDNTTWTTLREWVAEETPNHSTFDFRANMTVHFTMTGSGSPSVYCEVRPYVDIRGR